MGALFYSWQSDLPNTTNRGFIEKALGSTINKINKSVILEKAERESLELDRDTKGVSGTPPIVETIFNKISSADVFVPDLSFIGKSNNGRFVPNPNVLIEYGWALKALGYGRIVPVMNEAYGGPGSNNENMPFDMRHLRNPIIYRLEEGESGETKKRILSELVSKFESYIVDVLSKNGSNVLVVEPASVLIGYSTVIFGQALHKYKLNVSTTLNQKPDQDFFHIEIFWPSLVQIESSGFDEHSIEDIDGQKYIKLSKFVNKRIWPKQTVKIVGEGASSDLHYIVDDQAHNNITSKILKMHYRLYLQDWEPVEGEIPLTSLINY